MCLLFIENTILFLIVFMRTKNFSEELKSVFSYISESLLIRYNTDNITPDYFVLACLENKDCVAGSLLSKMMFETDFNELKESFIKRCENNSQISKPLLNNRKYTPLFDKCVNSSYTLSLKMKTTEINSAQLLLAIITNDSDVSDQFKKYSITLSQINALIGNKSKKESNDPIKHKKKKRGNETIRKIVFNESMLTPPKMDENAILGGLFDIINVKSIKGEVDEFLFGEEKYEEAFSVMSKKNKNNIAVVGKSGVGKTLFCENIANLISKGECPKCFSDKIIANINFFKLFEGTSMRGVFEARVDEIMKEVERNRNYVFLIDDLDSAMNSNFSSSEIEKFIDMLLETKYANVMITCSDKGYSNNILTKPRWNSAVTKIDLSEPTTENATEILKHKSESLSIFHDVEYDDEVFLEIVKLSKRYLNDRSLPDSAIDLLDYVSAKKVLVDNTPTEIIELQDKLNEVVEEKEKVKSEIVNEVYDEYDNICRKEIEIRRELETAEKRYSLEKQTPTITTQDVKNALSTKTGIPLSDLSVDEKQILKGMNERMKQVIIGQDEAVEEVCRSVKRQRTGISNPNKPVVFLFTGHTGVGKTYLAKTLAKELFGKEEQMVRLDMTEYSDKTSATKLIGSGSGYIGYDNGGILTEAIKKKKRCVLLLDEIEKANDEVNNMLLPVFDEGRLTDNKGYIVDFKNVIIIMTSNVGATKVEEMGNTIGFVQNTYDKAKDIIEKELRKKFRPEFINRIDKIVHFNKLNEEDLARIIKLEINKVRKRVQEIGYDFDDTILNGVLVEEITDSVKDGKYGARPIMRELQQKLEDKIVDYIIDNEVDKGHIFTYEELN